MQNTAKLILDLLQATGFTLNNFLDEILSYPDQENHFVVQHFRANFKETFTLLQNHFPEECVISQKLNIKNLLADELLQLTREEHGLRFNAISATFEQMESFRIETMAAKMEEVCPNLWKLVHRLLSTDDYLQELKEERWALKELKKSRTESSIAETVSNEGSFCEPSNRTDDDLCKPRQRNEALHTIVSVLFTWPIFG